MGSSRNGSGVAIYLKTGAKSKPIPFLRSFRPLRSRRSRAAPQPLSTTRGSLNWSRPVTRPRIPGLLPYDGDLLDAPGSDPPSSSSGPHRDLILATGLRRTTPTRCANSSEHPARRVVRPVLTRTAYRSLGPRWLADAKGAVRASIACAHIHASRPLQRA